MARIRTIKPEFWGDEKLAPQAPLVRLVFLGLISMADDAGRLIDNVKAIDGMLFPETDDTSRDALDTLASMGRIARYRAASGQRLIQVVGWDRHQKVDKPARHLLPAPNPEDLIPPTHPRGSRHSREEDATLSRDPRAPTLDLGPRTNDQEQHAHFVSGAASAPTGDGDGVIDLNAVRPSEQPAPPAAPPRSPDPAAEMMPWVRIHFRQGQGWPGRNYREQRQAEGRCIKVLRELIAAGRTPADVANALRGAVLLRDRGDLQRRGWVRVGEPMFTRILLNTSESGPSFWQEALDAYSRSLEDRVPDEPEPKGGMQRVVIELRGAA